MLGDRLELGFSIYSHIRNQDHPFPSSFVSFLNSVWQPPAILMLLQENDAVILAGNDTI